MSSERPSDPVRLGDASLAHLRSVVDEPDLSGTRYELRAPLGRGGMGSVWRAHDRQLERDVAIKVLALPESETGPALSARLIEEAKVLALLEHPGIVPVHDVGVLSDGRVYYAMKLVRGARLDERLRVGLSEGERLRVLQRIGEAVAFAHAHGVVHRDLKPANVMIGEFGEVLVLDWGLALHGAGGAGGTPAGTPGFMAPEQADGRAEVDARADVFALGRILASLSIPGRPAAAIAAKATAPEPGGRYGSVLEMMEDVARLAAGDAVRALPEGPLARLGRWYRRYRVAVWLVASYAFLRVGFEVLRLWLRGP